MSDQPSSQGYTTRSQRLNFDWRYGLTETSNVGVDLEAGRNDALDTSISDIDPQNSNRDFVTFRAMYNHRLTEHWWLNLQGRLRWQDREIQSDDASAAGIRVGVTYRPRNLSMSR